MEKIKVLVVDDEKPMRDLIRYALEKDGLFVCEATDGLEALGCIEKENYQIYILDVMMPGKDGWELVEDIRRFSQQPILMLTARNELKDKIQGFNLGADDYLTKPFEMDELRVRVQALIRRSVKTISSTELTITDGKILEESRTLEVLGHSVPMTKKEFELLLLFVKNPSRVYSREQLLDLIWGQDFFGEDRTVDQHIKNIREKFRKQGSAYNPIQTVWGVGYKFKEE